MLLILNIQRLQLNTPAPGLGLSTSNHIVTSNSPYLAVGKQWHKK